MATPCKNWFGDHRLEWKTSNGHFWAFIRRFPDARRSMILDHWSAIIVFQPALWVSSSHLVFAGRVNWCEPMIMEVAGSVFNCSQTPVWLMCVQAVVLWWIPFTAGAGSDDQAWSTSKRAHQHCGECKPGLTARAINSLIICLSSCK